MTRVALWLDFTSNQSVALSSMHFLYKYQYLPFSFLHFQLKHTVKAQPSSLVRDHSVQLLYSSSTYFLCSFTKLVSALFSQVPFTCKYTFTLYFPRLYTPVITSRSVRVLSFVVTCRQCLVHRITSHLSVTGWITRKYTRPVIKTKRVQAKRGVVRLFLVLNKWGYGDG